MTFRETTHDHRVSKCKHGTIIEQCRCANLRGKSEYIGPCPPHCVVHAAETERTREAAHRASDDRPSYFTRLGRQPLPTYVSPRDARSHQRTETTVIPRVRDNADRDTRVMSRVTVDETSIIPRVRYSDELTTTGVVGVARVPDRPVDPAPRGLRRLSAALGVGRNP